MKKIFYLFAITAFVFTSCNPLEDVNQDVDNLTANDAFVDDLVITLTDENYATLDLSFGSFSSTDDAKAALPKFLADTYPLLGVTYKADGEIDQASSALVTYKLFSPIAKKSYTVSAADYTAIGLPSLTDNDDINAFFDAKFPSEEKGTIYDLTYLTNPEISDYTLTDEDYDLVGNGRFDNFDIRTGRAEEEIEARRAKIQTILLNNFPTAEFGTKYRVAYEAFDGSTVNLELLVQLEENPTDPAKTTTYTLQDADYALIGNGTFNNFDIRDGSAEADVEVRRGKIETILLNNYPNAASGDFFVITYDTFDGAGRPVLTMILQFDGTNYNIFDVKKYEIYVFALESRTNRFVLTDDWAEPITFTSAEYALLGGSSRFNNFSGDATETERKIGVYLKTLFPFAGPDTFKAVQYDFFSGSVSTRNRNYVYDGSTWNPIGSVISTSLKFGHNGSTWVPDNTIKYTLTNADYASVDNGRFNNFDLRPGKTEETIEQRLVKLNIILKANFPTAAEGQKFSVTYAIFDGASGVRTTNVIKVGADYVLQ